MHPRPLEAVQSRLRMTGKTFLVAWRLTGVAKHGLREPEKECETEFGGDGDGPMPMPA